jgi:hypothetical protein
MPKVKNPKTSKKINRDIDFYFSVIEHVSKTNSLPLHLGSKQNLNYWLKPLRVHGVLVKKGYGVWDINLDKWGQWKALQQVKKTTGVAHPIRAHGFHFSLKVKHVQNWKQREVYLQSKEIPYILHPTAKCNQRIMVDNHKVWLSDKSITIYSPKDKSYFGDSAEEGRKLACYRIQQLLTKLNNLFGADFSDKGTFKVKICKQHYGKVKDELARQYNENKEKLHCYFEGALWLVIDHSLNEHETETLHPKTAVGDMDNAVVPFLNSIKENPGLTLNKIQGEIASVLNLVEGVTKNQVAFDANMVSHIDAVKALGAGVNELRAEVKKLSLFLEPSNDEEFSDRPSYIG